MALREREAFYVVAPLLGVKPEDSVESIPIKQESYSTAWLFCINEWNLAISTWNWTMLGRVVLRAGLRLIGAGLAGVLMTVFDISRLRCIALFLEFFEQCFGYCAGHACGQKHSVFALGNAHFFSCR